MVDDKLKPMTPPEIDLDPYLESLGRLLQSRKAQDLVIGLAGATGRLYNDMTGMGQFTPQDHPYIIQFRGTLQASDCRYDMLTLLPATEVLLAIHQLRKQPEMIAIAGQGAEDKRVQRFNRYTNRATHRLMGESGLVPLQTGSKSITLRRIQEIYGAIAIHYFCPEHRREQGFLAHYLTPVMTAMGHPSSPSSVAELDFKCVLTRDGTPLRARGVKVPSVGLPPIPTPSDESAIDVVTHDRADASGAIAAGSSSSPSTSSDTSETDSPEAVPPSDSDSKATASPKTASPKTASPRIMVAPRKRPSAQSSPTPQPVAAESSAAEAAPPEASGAGSRTTPEGPSGKAPLEVPASNTAPSTTPTNTYTTNIGPDIGPDLVATLQRIAEQQSGTIATQAETVARLHRRVEQLEARLTQLSIDGSTDTAQADARREIAAADSEQIQALQQSLAAEQQARAQLQEQVSHYRHQWLKTLDHLNQIRNAMRMPPIVVAADDDPAASMAEATNGDVPASKAGGSP